MKPPLLRKLEKCAHFYSDNGITWPHMLCFWFRPCWHRPCFFPRESRTESLAEHRESEQNEQNTLSALFSSARVPSLRWAEHQPLSLSLSLAGWVVCFKLRLQCLPPLQLRQTQSERRARVHTRIIHQSLRRGAHTTRDVNNTHALLSSSRSVERNAKAAFWRCSVLGA
jgi:hypothetical protein